jgi:hypothetical protein
MQLFSTPKQLLFLQLITNADGVSLQVNNMPVQSKIAFDELFRTLTLPAMPGANWRDVAANVLANDIGRATRRGTGNILFVPDLDTKTWFENNHFPHRFKVVIHRNLQPNELRCTYWQGPNNNWSANVVDGGIQYSPEGFSCLPNYSDYFTRCFL